jgi:hypothetical protein
MGRLRRACSVMAGPASVRRLMLCSSCMQGNLHVQFFGGSAAGRQWSYPITTAATDCVVDDGYFTLGAVRRDPARPRQA